MILAFAIAESYYQYKKMKEQSQIQQLEDQVKNLKTQNNVLIEQIEGFQESLSTSDQLQKIKASQCKIILRQARMERFISNEDRALYKKIGEHLKTFDKPVTQAFS